MECTQLCPACDGNGHHLALPEAKRSGPRLQLRTFLSSAIDASNADFGNIQLFNPATSSLRLLVHRGFDMEFLRFFSDVRNDATACGSAARSRARIVVPDVASDPVFQRGEAREVVLGAGVKAVQSTPLIGPSGSFLGVLSTHYRRVGTPSSRELAQLDELAIPYLATMDSAYKQTYL